MYIPRTLEPVIRRAAREFPAVVLTGPRQAGKTTLLKRVFGKSHGYVSLDVPDVRAAAIDDPRGFLAAFPPPVIYDEVQYTPDLLFYIKEIIDAGRDRAGQFVLTGSQNILLSRDVTESLAGRAAVLHLFPMSLREQTGAPRQPLPWEKGRREERKKITSKKLWETFFRGGYPELVIAKNRDISLWHASYVQTYLERDVRSLRQLGDLTRFQSFLRALAARSAQLLNITDLSRDLGIAANTAKSWLSLLEATHQIIILRPYFANIGKRLVKMPKVYFADTGTLCWLVGLKDPEHAAAGPMGGAIMETAVVNEIFRALAHRGETPQMYFWRTSAGAEVDLIVDTGNFLIPIEVKLSATPNRAMARNIEIFRKDFQDRAAKGWLVHSGDTNLPLGPDAASLPFYQM